MRDDEEMRYIQPGHEESPSESHQGPAREQQVRDQPMSQGSEEPARQQTVPGQPGRAPGSSLEEFRARFDEAQARFIDDPKGAVESARSALESAVDRFMTSIRSDAGEAADTERMRQVMRHYRAIFDQLSQIGRA